MELLQDPFSVYKIYIALKLHFSSASYSFIKYNGKCTASRNAFDKRSDKMFFFYVASKYSSRETVPFFIAQFVDHVDCWIGDFVLEEISANKSFTSWKNRIKTIKDNYLIDIHNLSEKGYTWSTLLNASDGEHPELFKAVIQKRITPETYVIIDKFTGFIDKSSNKLINDSLYCSINLKYKKYSQFIDIDAKKAMKLVINKLPR